ncbi:MAG: carboxypeptidase-like regulatory domain-containing protein [Planctomycetaceae bacterium]|nr:carboxypeptidase-like regulatory domain-containing protein [Planctomycetaceae bacterium]
MKFFQILLLLLVPFIFGCSPKTETQFVEGTVFLDNIPVSKATVTFIPLIEGSGEVASGFSDENGKFTLSSQYGSGGKGTLVGEYLVTVSQMEIKVIPSKTLNPDDSKTESKELLPPIYQDTKNSPLRIKIQQGKNLIRLDLKK